jgi:hypothetical protein
VPVAVAEVHRKLDPLPDGGDDLAVAGVQRAHAAEVLVVLLDGVQPLWRDPTAAHHVLQERADVRGALRATEGEHQQGIDGHPTIRAQPP